MELNVLRHEGQYASTNVVDAAVPNAKSSIDDVPLRGRTSQPKEGFET